MNKAIKILVLALFIAAILLGFFNYYSYIFAKTVIGEVTAVERVLTPMAILTQPSTSPPPAQIFSFAVAIKDNATGEIFTASSEDRQWAAVEKGFCAEAKFFPYPPWQLDKSGTYYGARLLRLYDCKNKPKE